MYEFSDFVMYPCIDFNEIPNNHTYVKAQKFKPLKESCHLINRLQI